MIIGNVYIIKGVLQSLRTLQLYAVGLRPTSNSLIYGQSETAGIVTPKSGDFGERISK